MLFTSENIAIAFQSFSKGKSKNPDINAFALELDKNIRLLSEAVRLQTWEPGETSVFFVHEPKQRKIEAAPVADRILHHALLDRIAPHMEKSHIFDSYACKKGKGVWSATVRLRAFFRKCGQNYTRPVFFLKCDIRKFFESLDRGLLYKMLRKEIKNHRKFSYTEQQEILFVAKKIIFRNDGKEKGIPIGNLTSQFFANLYLNPLDHFIKENLRARYYLRYMDDFVVVSHDREYLESARERISDYLKKKLLLQLHPQKRKIYSGRSGVDFLGFFLRPRYTLLRFSTKTRMQKKLATKNDEAFTRSFTGYFGYACRSDETKLLKPLWEKAFPGKPYRDYRTKKANKHITGKTVSTRPASCRFHPNARRDISDGSAK